MRTLSISMDRPALLLMLLFTPLWQWFYLSFRPDLNIGNWVAAFVGAVIIRFVLPKLPIGRSVAGCFTGVALAFMFAPACIRLQLFGSLSSEPVAVWGLVALIGDLLLQVVGWIVKLVQKFGNYTYEKPTEALDETFERVEQVASLWVRIKTPLLDLVDSVQTFLNNRKS